MRLHTTSIAVLAALTLAACGGAGGGSTLPAPGPQQPSQNASPDETAVATANSFGAPVKSLTNFNNGTSGLAAGTISQHATAEALTVANCSNGVEFWAPDKNGDANSTQEQDFYDAQCTQLARDAVRIYTISGTSENTNRTVKLYAIGNATPIATRSESVAITNATFDRYGYPIASDGFDRSQTGELDLSGTRTIVDDDEVVMLPATGNVSTYCGDQASYNATGFANLNETFGSAGGALSGGTRTVNGDGSVTWQATHTGTAYKGAIGSLSIALGNANTACPITAAQYGISGGTSAGTYSIPMSVTFKSGVLTNLTISNAQLANGTTLSVQTNAVNPTSNGFVTGTISNGSTQLSTFAVDAFGDGTLTVTSSGKQYVMTDWHVIK